VKVGLRLQAILRRYRPAGFTGDVIEMDLANGATVRDAVEALSVPVNLVQAVFINEEQGALDTALAEGDRVRVFPPVVGGS
jgi:molybdopterin converting factor small subunit